MFHLWCSSMLLWCLSGVLILVSGLLGVAFVTLLERKMLGLSQSRLGPNKVTLVGVLQPVADGIKLIFKELFLVIYSQSLLFLASPSFLLFFFFVVWVWLMPWEGYFSSKLSGLLFFSFLGVSAYAVILTGWSSLSAFSKLGSLRGLLQSLSFEVAIILAFFVVFCLLHTFMLRGESVLMWEWLGLWCMVWVILSLMETNRAPFDLIEGESELISGFNIEMSSLMFVFLFLSEYGSILVMSLVLSLACWGVLLYLGVVITCVILFLRSCFPRVRYDLMMELMWKAVLPVLLFYFSCSSILSSF